MWYSGNAPAGKQLRLELQQRLEEGYIVPDELKKSIEAVTDDSPNESFRIAYDALAHLSKDPAFRFVEPSTLEEIREARPASRMKAATLPYDREELLNRYHGAWLGRCVGCALGKPVETMGMWEGGHRAIRTYLEMRGDWPLRDYFSNAKMDGSSKLICPQSTRENIGFMESDDDIRYTLIGMMIFERFGKDFTSHQIAELWHETLTLGQVFTAERQALLNYGVYLNALPAEFFDPEFTSTFNNPYREWIGAQIRADFFGFMAPGNPEKAAEYAWRDACWTHRKNGIYGAMFIAAMEAAAFVTSAPEKLIQAGLGEIPENCRLAYEIRELMKVIPKYSDMDEFMEYMDKRFATMSPVHTINNAIICAAALFYGKMIPERCVCEAVVAGLDTDCNGATVGAITGIAAGFRDFGGTLAGRLNNLIKSEMLAFGDIRISEVTRRTLALYEKLA
ncbi:MAG: ADP-ribosylglycohydrolase family protein [Oligosphaeraceae bacterium]|nr:ADP-ribosylglycohydrolase family protein [Oligosphaeraceae bacterium]